MEAYFVVIPKSELGKWRLILDLSSPEGFSVNDGVERLVVFVLHVSGQGGESGGGGERGFVGFI